MGLLKYAEKLDVLRVEQCDHFMSRADEYYDSIKKVDELDHGTQILKDLREKCAEFDVKIRPRSKNQRKIQHEIDACIARLAYGDAAKTYEKEILKLNKFEKLNKGIVYQMPRRSGKTFLLAQWIASALLTVPGIRICLIGPSSRAATSKSGIMELVKDFLINILGWPLNKCDTFNEEHVIIRFGPMDKRSFSAYPGGATNKYVYSHHIHIHI